ncbi:TasA family protein [Fervidibacillus halotolerans]|uniref:CalY family protein n=1 Tax=Fervidibacillus halotolerans TaxID=2980027 RepID=A0A9E8RY45_9BACI|nr:TasA family protein [Fervidibacillus halotolerans]WAA11838.1 CalY family protein [Fervidibacillus halotolerans]
MVKKIAYFLLCFSLMFSFLGNIVFAESTSETAPKEIDIQTKPETLIFNLKNLKPGDWAVREVEIKNTGQNDFQYIVSSKKTAGSTKLYNALELTIKGESEILFQGKMSEFDGLEKRDLKSGQNEILELTVLFPMELGNEYQGLFTEVEFKFYAEGGSLGGILPIEGYNPKRDGLELPSTATAYYQLLLYGGFFLIGGITLYLFRKKILPKESVKSKDR